MRVAMEVLAAYQTLRAAAVVLVTLVIMETRHSPMAAAWAAMGAQFLLQGLPFFMVAGDRAVVVEERKTALAKAAADSVQVIIKLPEMAAPIQAAGVADMQAAPELRDLAVVE